MDRIHLSLLAMLAAAVLFFIDTDSGPSSPGRYLNGLGHLIYFALLAWWLVSLPVISKLRMARQLGIVLGTVLVAGVAVELIQPYFGRHRSWYDLGLNLLGGLTGLLFLAPFRRLLPNRLLAASRLAVLLAITAAFLQPASILWDLHQAERQFPVLGDFETRLEAGRWSNGRRDQQLARYGRYSLRVKLSAPDYAGTALRRSLGNWQGYSALAFSIYNPGPDPLMLTVSIRDQAHDRNGGRHADRFNRSFKVDPGWNDLRIKMEDIETGPEARTLKLDRLTEVIIFTRKLPGERVIHLDRFRLVP